jgi:hypothetical protein
MSHYFPNILDKASADLYLGREKRTIHVRQAEHKL